MSFVPQGSIVSHRHRRAFTLVELLVVIGIIALLIAILLPSLNRARDSALTITCASNMKQIGLAMMMYGNDFNGTVPPGDGQAADRVGWVEHVSLGSPSGEYTAPFTELSPQYAMWNFMDHLWIGGYLKHEARKPWAANGGTYGVHFPGNDKGVAHCPKRDPLPTHVNDGARDYGVSYLPNFSASPSVRKENAAAPSLPTTGRPTDTSFFRIPAWSKFAQLKPDKILVAEVAVGRAFEGVVYNPSNNNATNYGPRDVALRHGMSGEPNPDGSTTDLNIRNSANYLFADGSVQNSSEFHKAHRNASNVPAPAKQLYLDNWNRYWSHNIFGRPVGSTTPDDY